MRPIKPKKKESKKGDVREVKTVRKGHMDGNLTVDRLVRDWLAQAER